MLLEFMAKEGGISLLEVNPGLIIWTFIIFGIVLFLLHRFAWSPISQALDRRAEKIHSDIDRAQKLKEEAEGKLSQYLERLDSLKEEGQKLIEQSRKEAEEQGEKIMIQAREEASVLLEGAHREILSAKDKALAEVEKHIIDLTIQVASQVLERRLDPKDQKKFTEEALEALGNIKNTEKLQSPS